MTGQNAPGRDERGVTVIPQGPMLVEPVTEDGVTHTGDRFTSHRKRVRGDDSPACHDDSS